MFKINLTTKPITDIQVSGYVFLLESNFDFNELNQATKDMNPHLEVAIKNRNFTGKAGSSLLLNGSKDDKGVDIILVGLGDLTKGYLNVEAYRRAMGQMVRIAETLKLKSIALRLPDPGKLNLSYRRLAQETATMMYKAAYHFDDYITVPERKFRWEFDLYISVPQDAIDIAQEGITKGTYIGKAINTARYWCDLPPSALTPTVLANKAKALADKYGLKSTIFNQEEIIKMGMGGIHGVSKGSAEECRLVILEYKAQKADAPTIALVGKGVTFDSGGLSIKPSVAMETMKDDMAGAAVVLSTMKVLAQLKPDMNVIAVTPLVENLPSGTATKPGDILRFYNGKTAEVKDTDAEGRLILADALSYAVKNYKLNAIIDIATLTGSCAAALGHFYAGLCSQSDELAEKVNIASIHSGDRVWRLPMDDDYKPAIRSDVADLSNIGSAKYKAGAITAAFFLQSFVGDVPWVHLDIAGTAFGVPDRSYLRPGATGFGIRLFTDLIMNWDNHEL